MIAPLYGMFAAVQKTALWRFTAGLGFCLLLVGCEQASELDLGRQFSNVEGIEAPACTASILEFAHAWEPVIGPVQSRCSYRYFSERRRALTLSTQSARVHEFYDTRSPDENASTRSASRDSLVTHYSFGPDADIDWQIRSKRSSRLSEGEQQWRLVVKSWWQRLRISLGSWWRSLTSALDQQSSETHVAIETIFDRHWPVTYIGGLKFVPRMICEHWSGAASKPGGCDKQLSLSFLC